MFATSVRDTPHSAAPSMTRASIPVCLVCQLRRIVYVLATKLLGTQKKVDRMSLVTSAISSRSDSETATPFSKIDSDHLLMVMRSRPECSLIHERGIPEICFRGVPREHFFV